MYVSLQHACHRLQAWTGESGLGYAAAAMLQRLPRAQWLIVTLGKRYGYHITINQEI